MTHVIRILDHTGDTAAVYDPSDAVATEAARKTFNDFKAKGFLMAKFNGKGKPHTQIDVFDPEIVEIVAVPNRVGG